MKKIIVTFWVDIGFVNSERRETLEIEVNEDLYPCEQEKLIDEEYQDWVQNHTNQGWHIHED